MNLLNTNAANAKLAKSVKAFDNVRVASLSMLPDNRICPGSKAAGCMNACLKSAGRGIMRNVIAGRQSKTDYWHNDKEGFLKQLRKELSAFDALCKRTGVLGAVRLNVLSDIKWEDYGIPQSFPDLVFYDYTKLAGRLGKTPENYHLTFSYSGAPAYKKSVIAALESGANIAVVFRDSLPAEFMGKPVINGDLHDFRFLDDSGAIVGLLAKGNAKTDTSQFIVNPGQIFTV